MTEPQARKALSEWEPTRGGTPLTTSTLRAVNVGTMAREFQRREFTRARHPSRSVQTILTGVPPRTPPSTCKASTPHSFTARRSQTETLTQPNLWRKFSGPTIRQARNLIRTARQKGYLSEGVERRAGGQLTELSACQ